MSPELQKEFDKFDAKRRHLEYNERNAIEVKLLRKLVSELKKALQKEGLINLTNEEDYHATRKENEELRGWTSISDSMPNYYDHVLVYEPQSIYMAWLAVGDDGEYLWTVANSDGILSNVTHWKSLKPLEQALKQK
jgi:hypothetical protein